MGQVTKVVKEAGMDMRREVCDPVRNRLWSEMERQASEDVRNSLLTRVDVKVTVYDQVQIPLRRQVETRVNHHMIVQVWEQAWSDR
jgi:hypothetical protein